MKIFIVDDEKEVLISYQRLFKRRGITDVKTCDNGTEAIKILKNEDFDIVLLDLLIPDVDGLKILEETKPYRLNTEFIILTAVDEIETAVNAIRLGAYDFLVKPAESERIILSVERAYERRGLRAGLNTEKDDSIPAAFSKIITNSPRMKEMLNYADIMAKGGNSILITGESGTGKELLARGIHNASKDESTPFIAVNVASIPESLFESQFFGHKKGSFTGAENDFTGYFVQANGGTLFLDEIGELQPHQQVKLLRVLEEKEVTPIGSTYPIPINVRVVSATNIDIEKHCKNGKFRLDLLYRLKSAHIHLPNLNDRENDITLLSKHFLNRACNKHKKQIFDFSPEAINILMAKKYTGNIRELAQIIENAVLLCETNVILPIHLGEESDPVQKSNKQKLATLKENSDNYIQFVLNQTNNDKKEAAKILGLSLRQLQRRVSEISHN